MSGVWPVKGAQASHQLPDSPWRDEQKREEMVVVHGLGVVQRRIRLGPVGDFGALRALGEEERE